MNKRTVLSLKVIGLIIVSLISFESVYGKYIFTLEIPLSETPVGDMSKRTVNGHSIVVYRRTSEEMVEINTKNNFIVFEDSNCLIIIKINKGKKYFESAKALYDNCGRKYNINGKGLNHIPYTQTTKSIIVSHGYLEWL